VKIVKKILNVKVKVVVMKENVKKEIKKNVKIKVNQKKKIIKKSKKLIN
jgi:hypothetical protein